MKSYLLFTVLLSAFTFTKIHTQMSTNNLEMQAFARDYMAAYNQQDTDALRKMYSEYVSRTDQEGKEMVGAGAVLNYLQEQFQQNNATLLLRQTSVHWSDAEHAWVTKGTYDIYGMTNVYDIEVNTTGAYTNTMIKDKDQWKIARTVLTPIVKVMVYHEVKDVNQWMSAFAASAPLRKTAGEASAEIGIVHDQPNTVYILSEWPSVTAFQEFFADPDLKQVLQDAGVVGQPTVLILDQE